MATSETASAFERLMARARHDLPEPVWAGPGDLGRMSIEAIIAQSEDPRELSSRGALRLSGAGVTGHAAPLDEVGSVAMQWQRCVTAVGAALEGAKGLVGKVPQSVSLRTQMVLNAAPARGSIVLDLAPKTSPLPEVQPGGQKPMFNADRPLADRATETLLGMLSKAVTAGLDADDLGAELQRLGPRVAASLRRLADVLDKGHFDVDALWAEPERPTQRVSMSAGTAGWLRDFVAGRALDGREEEMEGIVRTVSDIAKWSIDTAEGMKPVDARSLDPEVIRQTHVGQFVRLIVLVRVTERPDGSTSTTYEALTLEPARGDEEPPRYMS